MELQDKGLKGTLSKPGCGCRVAVAEGGNGVSKTDEAEDRKDGNNRMQQDVDGLGFHGAAEVPKAKNSNQRWDDGELVVGIPKCITLYSLVHDTSKHSNKNNGSIEGDSELPLIEVPLDAEDKLKNGEKPFHERGDIKHQCKKDEGCQDLATHNFEAIIEAGTDSHGDIDNQEPEAD
ncbi:hypothetical protein HG531_004942 [Fusarium graminearum]|nr:hypothetical protein HG531_004942 [Fusarium graminearum]